jgi:hypothetical protein
MNIVKNLKLKEKCNIDVFMDTLSKLGIDINKDLLIDSYLGEPLKNYLYLTYLPEMLSERFDELTKYYSRYFWLSTVSTRYKKKFGCDNGFEQQVFKLIEEAEQENLDVDWQTVESIEKEAILNIN